MHPILKAYFPIADMIVGTFGDHCEVVLHDLTQPENSAVYVANGTVTGRRIGQPFDRFVKQVLMNKEFHDDFVVNYHYQGKDGKMMKSSAALIRDEENNVIGVMYINLDVTMFAQMAEQFNLFVGNNTAAASDDTEVEVEGHVEAILNDLIMKIIGNADVHNMPRSQCVKLIKFMDDKGIFLVKGAIDKVASLMGVSKVTIYSYLDEAKGKR